MNYIDNTIRSSSMNPSISNICSTLKKFDDAWNDSFKTKLPKSNTLCLFSPLFVITNLLKEASLLS